jgi:hypothetical protein
VSSRLWQSRTVRPLFTRPQAGDSLFFGHADAAAALGCEDTSHSKLANVR